MLPATSLDVRGRILCFRVSEFRVSETKTFWFGGTGILIDSMGGGGKFNQLKLCDHLYVFAPHFHFPSHFLKLLYCTASQATLAARAIVLERNDSFGNPPLRRDGSATISAHSNSVFEATP